MTEHNPAPQPTDDEIAAKAKADAAAEKKRISEENKAKKAAANEAAKAEKKRLKAEKDAEKEAKKAEKEAKKTAEPVAKDVKNGIARPKAGVTKTVWDTADQLSKEAGQPIERSVLSAALDGQVQTGTIHTQYGRWRKYYGLSETREARRARLDSIRDAKKLEAEKNKQIKAAQKKAADDAKAAKAAAKQPELPIAPQAPVDDSGDAAADAATE
jgi:colicin import membrane protein